jgi:hypothetical protein
VTKLLAILALALAAAAAGCGGGGKCADGCSRMKSCAEKLNCAGLDPMQQPQCNAVKKELAGVDCSPLDTYCPDQSRARFEQAATCTLDTTVTCQCR